MIKNLFAALLLCTCLYGATAKSKNADQPKDSWLTKCLADKGTYILESKDSVIWGCAPMYDDEGRVHVYYSTWKGSGSWLCDSEIAHAVADHPEGPYRTLGTILKGREGEWDRHTIHNPSVYRIDGKYVLLYIGNDTLQQTPRWKTDGRISENLQHVGMAIADSPYGPWKRFDKPIVEASPDAEGAWDSYCAVNPSILKHPNGEYWLYYRSWDRHNDDRRKTGLAIAKSLEGPYIKYDGGPVIDFPEMGGQTEDPYFFYYNGKFHCLIRDMGNYDWVSNFYLESDDGIHWGEYQRGHHQGSHYYPIADGSRCERVQMLWRNGEPEYLFNAIHRHDGYRSGGALRINMPNVEHKLPPAPDGYVWQLNDKLSDEFDGDKINAKLWEVEYGDDLVSIVDGRLNISTALDGKKYSTGSVKGKSLTAYYGYYECRMKCNSLTDIPSNFLMRSSGNVDYQELSIAEVVGKTKDKFHATASSYVGGQQVVSRGKAPLLQLANEEYHTYGCWWQNDSTMLFYLDGEYQFTIHANTQLDDHPFDETMYLRLFTSISPWCELNQDANDSSINNTTFDWVRSYNLVPIKK